MKVILAALLLIFYVKFNSSERILFLLPLASKSHFNVFEPLINGLALRGHTIDVVSSISSQSLPNNVTKIILAQYEDIFQDFNPIEQRRNGKFHAWIRGNWSFLFDACHGIYQNEEFQTIYQHKYDLIFSNIMMNRCMSGLFHKFQAPFIYVTTFPVMSYIANMAGVRFPPSFVPSQLLGLTDNMNFLERSFNVIVNLLIDVMNSLIYEPKYEVIYRKYLGEDYPPIHEIESKVSLIMENSDFSINFPKPTTPEIVEVGGMHCRPSNPLPKDLNDFLSGDDEGFIYFSLGSIIKSKDMTKEHTQILFNVFSRLKQRVLWKWDNEIEGLPPNVLIKKWLPQQDILGHKNIRLFITHGGLLSTQEAVYHGVPLLGIPVFADQDINMKQAKLKGYAMILEILDLSEDMLYELIINALKDNRMAVRAKELSAIFRDQMSPPLERAIYWSEYVMRHKGAPQLQSAARDLNFFSYYCIDVLAFLFGILFTLSLLLRFAFLKCCKMSKRQKLKKSKSSGKNLKSE